MNKPLIVITGASSGIGKAVAEKFNKNGFPLLLLARRVEKLLEMEFSNTICNEVDVTDFKKLNEAVKNAEQIYGPTDCFINNAGIMLLGQIETQEPEEWIKMYNVNVLALLNGVQSVLSGMKKRKKGTIINISSIAGRKTFLNHAAYCGSKFAVHAISENVREEVANHNVRVITIAPGVVETELLSHTTSSEIKNGYENWKKDIGGAISPANIADSIYFAYGQPQNVCIREIVIAATRQQQ